MDTYEHILFAWDLSDGTKVLAKRASNLAKSLGAKLTLLTILEPQPAYGFMVSTDEPSEEALAYATSKMAELVKSLDVHYVNGVIETGNIKQQIISYANAHGVDCILIGSHGVHGVADLIGSTASAVIHKAHCDVLTLRVNPGE